MSVGRTVTDLSDAMNRKDCAHEIREILDRVIDQRDDMAISGYCTDFMKKWGDAIVSALLEIDDDESDAIADLKSQIADEKSHNHERMREIRDAFDEAESAMRDLEKVISQ